MYAGHVVSPGDVAGDGDQMFAVSVGPLKPDFSLTALGAVAADLVADTIVRAARVATGVEGWPATRDLK